MKRISILTVIAAALACGGTAAKPPIFTQPAGTVAVGITIDDTANQVFKDGDMQWKGSMVYDATTNKVIKDPTWAGPFAPLYDDGPLSAGGHEPEGSVAGDHKFGTVVFVTPPATGAGDTYEYGLIDNVYEKNFGNGWIWQGSNGTFTVAPGATAAQKADGLTLKKFGTTDLQLSIDTNNLIGGTWDKSKITVKGSAWAWSEVKLTPDGSGKATFTLSDNVGAGKTFVHTGLVNSGDKPEFIFVFNGKEYKTASGTAATTGVSAGVKASGGSAFSPVTVAVNSANKNTYVPVP